MLLSSIRCIELVELRPIRGDVVDMAFKVSGGGALSVTHFFESVCTKQSLLKGERPCWVRNTQTPVPIVGVLKEAAL